MITVPADVFDYETLANRLGGKIAVIQTLIDLLMSTYPNDRAELQSRLADGNASAVRDTAHRVKGQLQTMGIGEAALHAKTVEQAAALGDLETARVASEELDRALNRFRDYVRPGVALEPVVA